MAANPTMVVRIAANYAQLQAGLSQAQTAIQGAQASIVKMGVEGSAAMAHLGTAAEKAHGPTEGLTTRMVAVGAAIGTMAANAVMALAGLAVNGIKALATGIADLVTNSAQVAGIDRAFRQLTDQINQSGNAMLGAMRTGTRGLVTDLDLMTAANKAILLGLPATAKEMGSLSQTAVTLGRAMGLGATKSIDDFITALAKSSPEILNNLGLTVKIGDANDAYAAKMGILGRELNAAEKTQAFYEAALVKAAAKVATMGDAHLTLGERIAQAGIWWDNFKNDLGTAIAKSPALTAAMDVLGKAFGAAFGGDSSTRVQTMIGYINTFAIAIVDGGLILVEWGRTGAQVFGALQVPIKTVTIVVATLIERFASGIATLADLASRLPGVGSAFDGVAAATKKAADFWANARQEASSSLKASLDLASGQGAVHGALDKVAGVLTTMKAKMVEASLTSRDFTEKTDAQREAARKAAEAHAANEVAIAKSTAALKAFMVDSAKFEAGIKNLEPGVALFQNMERKLTPLAVSMKGLESNTGAANVMLANMDTTLTPLAASIDGLSGGLHFAAETIESEVVPALAKTEETIRKISLTWSEAMDLVRQGQGSMTGTLPGNTDSSDAHRAETQRLWDAHQYWGPVRNGTPSNPRGTGPDWERIGFPARAMGGPVNPNQPYVVGERGPELFVPQQAGNVVANGGGGLVVHVGGVHVHGSFFGNEEKLATQTSHAMMQRLKDLGVKLPARA